MLAFCLFACTSDILVASARILFATNQQFYDRRFGTTAHIYIQIYKCTEIYAQEILMSMFELIFPTTRITMLPHSLSY